MLTIKEMDEKMLNLLVDGREYLATHEWNRSGTYFNKTLSCVCGVGAVMAAVGVEDWEQFTARTGFEVSDIRQELDQHLPPGYPDDFYSFNDDAAETKADVLAVFDRAIEKLRLEA
jgi:hypothetical protein